MAFCSVYDLWMFFNPLAAFSRIIVADRTKDASRVTRDAPMTAPTMTRDELVERMAISAFWESPTRWGIPGGDFKNISERDRAAFRNMMYVALTELEKHAVVVPAEPTEEMRDKAGEVLWGNTRAKADEWAKADKFDSWAAQGADVWRAMLAARPR